MMIYERKKIRGFKRHKRNIEKWKMSQKHLNMDDLKRNKRDYVKVWINPFYGLKKYHIPNWYKKEIINSLIEIYDYWNGQLKDDYNDYYLKIWLFEKNFMSSQVVVSVDNYRNFYDRTFENDRNNVKLPEHSQTSSTKKLNWDKKYTVTLYEKDELEDNLKEGILTKKEVQHIKDESDDLKEILGKQMYVVKDDVVYTSNY